MRLAVQPAASRLVVRTRATGLLARLAHDLEIVSRELEGGADLEGDAWTAELTVPVASLRVAGTLHGDRLDPSALSVGDRSEIERRLHQEVLAVRDVVARASGSSRERGEVVVSIGAGSTRVATRVTTRETVDGIAVSGSVELSLRALGLPEIKGPLGAFKVSDAVLVAWEIQLA